MDNLVKALKCREMWHKRLCKAECRQCEYYQTEYANTGEVCEKAKIEIVRLDKSNRNWRRKCQRLRHELKEVKEHDIP